AAQAEVVRLEAVIEHKTRRLRILRDNYERHLRVADTAIATHTAELKIGYQNWIGISSRLPCASARRLLDVIEPGQSASSPVISAARDTIARLEKRINQVEKSQKSRQDLELALTAIQQERDSLAVQIDELIGQLGERFMEVTDLRAEPGQAQERLSSIASFLPSALSHKRARS
ncbi:hypothetical protein F442_22241, partial [Phytophthora nicotianae P10297]